MQTWGPGSVGDRRHGRTDTDRAGGLMILRAELEQHQTPSKDVGTEAPVLRAVLKG